MWMKTTKIARAPTHLGEPPPTAANAGNWGGRTGVGWGTGGTGGPLAPPPGFSFTSFPFGEDFLFMGVGAWALNRAVPEPPSARYYFSTWTVLA
jgi:hypothetical protein